MLLLSTGPSHLREDSLRLTGALRDHADRLGMDIDPTLLFLAINLIRGIDADVSVLRVIALVDLCVSRT